MRLRFVLSIVIASLAVSLAAQTPAGWKMRIDRSQSANDPDDRPDVTFMSMGSGLHVMGGPAGVFWRPDTSVAGDFTVKGTFVLNKPSSHTNYYGLVFGGRDLDAAGQRYVYFVVAQNGMFLIRQRNGENVTDVAARTMHAAVKQPDSTGRSSNDLEVRVSGGTVSFLVNGTVVHTAPASSMSTDGLVGFRVNHQLDVMVEGFSAGTS
jgi:hypothetical protein